MKLANLVATSEANNLRQKHKRDTSEAQRDLHRVPMVALNIAQGGTRTPRHAQPLLGLPEKKTRRIAKQWP